MSEDTTNLSKIKRDKMLKTIRNIKKNSANDKETLDNLSLIEYELTKKKYGLVWEEHEERIDKELETQIPVFKDIDNRTIITNEKSKFNFLLEGDNLHSLYLLEKTHNSKINVIYIDPPYNTGNKDFIYNDTFIDYEDGYRHSKWLSFMSKRLVKAKNLLCNNGIIFISIDNNEYSQLKLLCDEIFGELAYITTLSVEMSATQGMKVRAAKQGNIVKNTEYILIYRKNGKKNIGINPLLDLVKYDSHYNLFLIEKDEYFEEISLAKAISNNSEVEDALKAMKFLDKNKKLSNNQISEAYEKCEAFRNWINKNADFICRSHDSIDINEDKKDKLIVNYVYKYKSANREYLIVKAKDNTISQRILLSEKLSYADDFYNTYGPTRIRGDWWPGFYLDMGNISKEGNVKFENGKKPIRLIKQLLKLCSNKHDIILDFFAGSGTTAHAVLELNKDDNGERQFIICTNNENNICENFTYPRLKNIINGYGKYKAIRANLKYLKTSYVPRMNFETENLRENLLVNIKNLIQLENGINIDDNVIRVILSENKIDEFAASINQMNDCERLYISSDILITDNQEKLFKNNNIEVLIIPEYYFAKEIMEVE